MNLYKMAVIILFFIFSVACENKMNISNDKHTRDNFENKLKSYENSSRAEDQQSSDKLIRIQEQNITYKFQNQEQKITGFLKYNDNQNFSMYVLPQYELLEEKPQKDVLLYKKNKSIFMKVELLPEDVDWKSLKKSAFIDLSTFSSEVPTETPLNGKYLEESAIFEVTNNREVLTIYFINQSDLNLKLAMYTKKDEDHRDAFFQMAKTIMKEAPLNQNK